MKAKIIHVLCEGQTEQGFVEEVLRPYLQAQGVAGVKSILITTNKKKNARGGMLSYAQAVTDLELLRKMKMDGEYERHVFTTMFDLYALPDDFPGYEAAKAIGEPYARVAALETAFAEAINDSRFIPYIQLHEFEALLFCGIDYLAKRYPGCEKRCEQLKKDLEKTSNPELIIIRKSKCSTDFKRNDFLKKTKRTHWVRFVHLNSLIESCVFLYLWNSPFDTFL